MTKREFKQMIEEQLFEDGFYLFGESCSIETWVKYRRQFAPQLKAHILKMRSFNLTTLVYKL